MDITIKERKRWREFRNINVIILERLNFIIVSFNHIIQFKKKMIPTFKYIIINSAKIKHNSFFVGGKYSMEKVKYIMYEIHYSISFMYQNFINLLHILTVHSNIKVSSLMLYNITPLKTQIYYISLIIILKINNLIP